MAGTVPLVLQQKQPPPLPLEQKRNAYHLLPVTVTPVYSFLRTTREQRTRRNTLRAGDQAPQSPQDRGDEAAQLGGPKPRG